ncbi:MAG: hypothetical protein ABIJ28_02785 [Patescibacteria group bacterium]
MAIPWRTKKQALFFIIFLAILVFLIILAFVFFNSSSCFDGKKNQEEEEIDCGGPCGPCLGATQNLIIYWTKIFKVKERSYEAVVLLGNPNLFAGADLINYKINVYDEKNILVTVRKGQAFLNPNEKFLIFETNLDTGERVPKSAFLEIEENIEWKRIEKEKPQLVVTKKDFLNQDPFPRLTVEISNKSLLDAENIDVFAVIFDKDKNAKAASISKINYLKGETSQEAIFTWPEKFSEEPNSIEVFTRVNLLK